MGELLVCRSFGAAFEDVRKVWGLNSGEKVMIAGPCAIYDAVSFEETVAFLKSWGTKLVRAAAFKPRTSPFLIHFRVWDMMQNRLFKQ
ncbi:hypothetical protein FACS1894198_1310 [Clostridia bacterium]|nr:hypothetical protein FACS1894198_1310 [Clostridia bacterium]